MKAKVKIPHFVAAFLLFYPLSVAVHEYAHFLTLLALGGKGHIVLTSCIIEELPPAFSHLVYLSGGLGCAAFYFLLWLIDEDPEHRVILPAIAARHLVYGVGEGLWALTWNPLFAEAGDLAGFLVLLAVVLFTFMFGYYPLAPGEFRTIKRLRPEWARLLSMWFNSTPNLAQIFLDRTETRGTWMKIDISTLKESRIVDPRRLTHGEMTAISNVFNEVGACSFPSIVDQLEANHSVRRKIDKAMLKVIGFDDEEAGGLLNELCPRLHKEIMALKELMAG